MNRILKRCYGNIRQLMDDFGMSRVNADWIVSVWCSCYGGKVLGKGLVVTGFCGDKNRIYFE